MSCPLCKKGECTKRCKDPDGDGKGKNKDGKGKNKKGKKKNKKDKKNKS